ncbi:MAG: hypothetical protein JNL89_09710 [Rhodanobacteraceae bacterium]|nr:hypothetical protein [Rhodanobacteraceae bacterium]
MRASAGTGGPVNFTGVTTIGSSGNGVIAVTPSGGAASGTTTLTSFTLSGADAASFTRTSAATMTFTAGIATPQNITFTCVSGAFIRTANLQVTETVAGGATSQRFWVLVCPAGNPPSGPTLSYNPFAGSAPGGGGRVDFTGNTGVGSTGVGVIVVTPSGGANGGVSTLSNFILSGPDAGSFAVVSAPTLTFAAGVNTPQNINLTCITGADSRTAFLQASELVTDTVVQRYWVLSCVADYFADGFESTDGLFADGFE